MIHRWAALVHQLKADSVPATTARRLIHHQAASNPPCWVPGSVRRRHRVHPAGYRCYGPPRSWPKALCNALTIGANHFDHRPDFMAS